MHHGRTTIKIMMLVHCVMFLGCSFLPAETVGATARAAGRQWPESERGGRSNKKSASLERHKHQEPLYYKYCLPPLASLWELNAV